MIRSMTGFGKASGTYAGRKVEAEVRALNSKAADLGVKLPALYRDKEMEVRELLTGRLERGKIDLYVSLEPVAGQAVTLNREAAETYFRELAALAKITGQQQVDYVAILSRFPDVLASGSAEADPEEWKAVLETILGAVEALDAFRIHEGEVLGREMASRIANIEALLGEVVKLEPDRTELRREKIRKALAELAPQQADPSRFEQEMIYYLEKLDFTEERVRLLKHLEYFLSAMLEPGSQGRKLGFITQEMGREINTLGSKAYDADIQRLVVGMKDELEKIKEQLGNIL